MGRNSRIHDEIERLQALEDYESLEMVDDFDDAETVVKRKPRNMSMRRGFANVSSTRRTPPFKVQFDINVYLLVGAKPLAPVAQKIPVPFFGTSDYFGLYSNVLNNNPVQGVVKLLSISVLNQSDAATFGVSSGSLRFLFADDDANYSISTIIECPQVAYTTLLNSLISDRFKANLTRMTLPSDLDLSQFSNRIDILKQTLFGVSSKDSINPGSFKNPDQNQKNIIDIPTELPINKEQALSTYINFTGSETVGQTYLKFSWSMFADQIIKTV